jgi:fatty-acyl-CoA synthase
MGDGPLTVRRLLEHGASVHPRSHVINGAVSATDSSASFSFSEIAQRALCVAGALRSLGVAEGDVVATCCWNHVDHMLCYLAVPSMGAVLHTVNVRLTEEQLAHVLCEGAARVLVVDADLLDYVRPVLGRTMVEHVLVVGTDATSSEWRFTDLVEAADPLATWPQIDERSAAGLCHTSGTTGLPKGVVYSHRSTYLHALALCAANTYAIGEHDSVLVVVPMFHANAWGLPHAAWLAGADVVLPGRLPKPAVLAEMIERTRPTVSSAVPTVWLDLVRYAEAEPVDLSSFRLLVAGGSRVDRSLIEALEELGVTLVQGWGMTETSPLLGLSTRPRDPGEDDLAWRARTGRIIPGVEIRIVDEHGEPQPWDDRATGEIEARGPWVTASYLGGRGDERFHDGWLRTGDVGRVDDQGYVDITDRLKDLIKSGGEWISPSYLEEALLRHPDVGEAIVVGVPDDRWQERPLACVVPRPGSSIEPATLARFLAEDLPAWMVPDRWALVTDVPRTAVGKPDRRAVLTLYETGVLTSTTVAGR